MATPDDRKTEILERVRATHHELEEAVSRLTPHLMTTPGVNGDWAAKDVLAHVTWWEQHLLRRLRNGVDDLYTPGGDPREATHRVNAEVFAANHDRPPDSIRAEFDAS